MTSPLNVLVVRPDAIGDVVLMLPALNSLKQAYPHCRVTMLQSSLTKDLLVDHPAVDAVIEDWRGVGQASGLLGFRRYARFLAEQSFDVVVLSYLEPYYAALAYFARIPVRVGDRNKLGLRWMLTHGASLDYRNILIHEVEQNIRLFQSYFSFPDVSIQMGLNSSDATIERARLLLENEGWNGEPFILIHPTTGGHNRAWTPAKYGALSDLIQTRFGCRVVVSGHGEGDEQVVQQMRMAASEPIVSLVGCTTLPELLGVITLSRLVIGSDTGPTHIAAAVRRPVVSISPTKFVKSLQWGPWGVPNRVIGSPRGCPLVCFPLTCDRPDCLESIQLDQVAGAVDELIRETDQDLPNELDLLKANRAEWFRKSVYVGFVVRTTSSEMLRQLKQEIVLMGTLGIECYVIVETESIRLAVNELETGVEVIVASPRRLLGFSRMVAKRNIGVLRVLEPTAFIWWCVRQLAALWMIAPPIIESRPYIGETVLDIVDRYRPQ